MSATDNLNVRSEKEIFFAALDQPSPDARAAFLEGACGKNPALRQRVEQLLVDHFQQDDFLRTAAVEGSTTELASTPVLESPGTRIDRYKLLQKLGEGGFGVVYM